MADVPRATSASVRAHVPLGRHQDHALHSSVAHHVHSRTPPPSQHRTLEPTLTVAHDAHCTQGQSIESRGLRAFGRAASQAREARGALRLVRHGGRALMAHVLNRAPATQLSPSQHQPLFFHTFRYISCARDRVYAVHVSRFLSSEGACLQWQWTAHSRSARDAIEQRCHDQGRNVRTLELHSDTVPSECYLP